MADDTVADDTAADHTAADHTAADHTAADHTAADHTAADDTAAGHTAADDTAARQMQQRVLQAYARASAGTLSSRMGIKITEASPGRVVGTMPVTGNTQPYGLLHGGASCVLAETLGSLGSAMHAGPDRVTVGIEISATHHRGAAQGEVTGVATLVHGGRTLTTYEVVITDELGRRVCTCRLTSMLRDAVPGDRGPADGGS